MILLFHNGISVYFSWDNRMGNLILTIFNQHAMNYRWVVAFWGKILDTLIIISKLKKLGGNWLILIIKDNFIFRDVERLVPSQHTVYYLLYCVIYCVEIQLNTSITCLYSVIDSMWERKKKICFPNFLGISMYNKPTSANS